MPMSLRTLQEFTSELPYAIREQVLGYARSVRDAAPEICREAEVPPSLELVDQLMWLAAMKRLHTIVGSAYWTLENANALLQQHDAGPASVGSTDYAEGSLMYATLSRLQGDLGRLEQDLGLVNLIRLPWPEAARALADERRSS